MTEKIKCRCGNLEFDSIGFQNDGLYPNKNGNIRGYDLGNCRKCHTTLKISNYYKKNVNKKDEEKIQEIFEETKRSIKRRWGLELSLIEKVRLKRYIKPVLEDLKNLKYDMNKFEVPNEVESRFMTDYYGLPPLDQKFFSYLDDVLECDWTDMRDYLKLIQNKSHLP